MGSDQIKNKSIFMGGFMSNTKLRAVLLVSTGLVASLARGIDTHNRRPIPTMDRRAFLRRSGLGVGVGLAASQLTLVQRKAQAQQCAAHEAGQREPGGKYGGSPPGRE